MRSVTLGLIALAFVVAACGGTGMNSNMQPNGASLQGSLDPSSLASMQGPIQVSVSGASQPGSQTTQIDSKGMFRFDGLAAGSADLHFKGGSVDTSVTIPGLADSQTLSITFAINGQNVQVVQPMQANVQGQVTAIKPPLVFVVANLNILTDAATQFEFDPSEGGIGDDDVVGSGVVPISFANLRIGQNVEVNGVVQANGLILATTVEVNNAQHR
jgi:hypothetical protein